MTEHANFHWNELMTADVEAAKAFYEKTIGWKFDSFPMENGTYWVAMAEGKPVGGIMSSKGIAPPGMPAAWFAYLAVDDIDKRIALVKDAGGQVMREPFDVPMVGRIAMVADATGAAIGWITPAEM